VKLLGKLATEGVVRLGEYHSSVASAAADDGSGAGLCAMVEVLVFFPVLQGGGAMAVLQLTQRDA
jgi:hypothetical protein